MRVDLHLKKGLRNEHSACHSPGTSQHRQGARVALGYRDIVGVRYSSVRDVCSASDADCEKIARDAVDWRFPDRFGRVWQGVGDA